MGRKVNLTGQRFGMWTVLGEVGKKDNSHDSRWNCVCDCGESREVSGCSLRRGGSSSCGCVRRRNITGKTFGQLTALRSMGKNSFNNTLWECSCECGNLYTVPYSALASGNTKTCGHKISRKLTNKRYGKLLVVGSSEKVVDGREFWECLCDCGLYKTVYVHSLLSGRSKSCGCGQIHKGEEHPNYNPSMTDEERLKNRYQLSGGNSSVWSQQVKERDNYTCQICGNSPSGKLNSHHINAWSAFPEQRFDLDNGVTLCVDCHKEFHKMYGRGGNTREQFDEYAASKTLVLN